MIVCLPGRYPSNKQRAAHQEPPSSILAPVERPVLHDLHQIGVASAGRCATPRADSPFAPNGQQGDIVKLIGITDMILQFFGDLFQQHFD